MGASIADLLTWSADYELGVEEIDLQHRYFLSLINRLHHELQNSGNHEHQVALFSELNAYAKFHFISEENMMLFAGYDQLAEHQRHHYELIDQLNAKESGLNVRYDAEEAKAVVDFLVHWFKAHTTAEDRQFAEFLQQRHAGE